MTQPFLPGGALQVLGRLPDSSNNALLCSAAGETGTQRVVYKPVAGEQPLWDFPHGTLTRREKAAAVLDELLGWHLVPQTEWIDEGPAGPGILQAWVEADIDLGIFPQGEVPPGWIAVVEADTRTGPVDVAQRDDDATRRMIVFDILANNADRKGGHLLRNEQGLFGIDHGVTFHVEPKLRTVLWGLMGDAVPEPILADVRAALPDMAAALQQWLDPEEVSQTQARARDLLDTAVFPEPTGQWPALPWPLI